MAPSQSTNAPNDPDVFDRSLVDLTALCLSRCEALIKPATNIVRVPWQQFGKLLESTTRFTMPLHLPRMAAHGVDARMKNGPALAGHATEAVRDSIAGTITGLPKQLRQSLTWDQGAEMSQHTRLKIDTGLDVYFCDPHIPWQRGTNEITNGLLRHHFPKGTDLSAHSKNALQPVALALNTRPRRPWLEDPLPRRLTSICGWHR